MCSPVVDSNLSWTKTMDYLDNFQHNMFIVKNILTCPLTVIPFLGFWFYYIKHVNRTIEKKKKKKKQKKRNHAADSMDLKTKSMTSHVPLWTTPWQLWCLIPSLLGSWWHHPPAQQRPRQTAADPTSSVSSHSDLPWRSLWHLHLHKVLWFTKELVETI